MVICSRMVLEVPSLKEKLYDVRVGQLFKKRPKEKRERKMS